MPTLNCFIIVAAFLANQALTRPGSLDSVLVPARPQELQRRAISPDVLLNNGKLAQGLNAKYATMTMETSCKEGDHACLQGGFAQCVSGKYVSLGCAPPTVCFELPLLLKPGSVPGCTTPADAAARIANTGVQGGVKGDGTETSASSNTTSPIVDAPSLNGTDMGMSDMSNASVTANASDATPAQNATSNVNTTASGDDPSAVSTDAAAFNSTAANTTLPTAEGMNSTASGASNATSPNTTETTSSNATKVPSPIVSDNSTDSTAADAKPTVSGSSTSSSEEEDCVEE